MANASLVVSSTTLQRMLQHNSNRLRIFLSSNPLFRQSEQQQHVARILQRRTILSASASTTLPHYNRQLSTSTVASSVKFAAVDHAEAYEQAIAGRHGKQLALAYLEGKGKDDAPFDPFDVLVENDNDDDEEEEEEQLDENTQVAEFVEKEEETIETASSSSSSEEEEESTLGTSSSSSLLYNNDGSLVRPKSQLAAFKAGAPAGGVFAIIELGGTQHKITVDDVIISNKLKPVSDYAIGTVHEFDPLLVGSSHVTLVGLPHVGGTVKLMVEEITRDATILVFKKRRKKHSRRKNGFRRQVTMLRVLDITLPEEYNSSSSDSTASSSTDTKAEA